METSSKKFYHVHDNCSRGLIDTYLSDDEAFREEAVTFPLTKLHQVFCRDHIKGDLLIEISMAPVIHLLHSASEYFQKIILLRATDSCIFELRRWLHDRTGAFCWKHTAKFAAEKKGDSDLYEDTEIQLKEKIIDIIKCNLECENITEPVEVPQADCIISLNLLDSTSKDQDDYCRNLRKILTLLKLGGHLILFGCLNATYYINKGEKFHFLKCDEEFVCSALKRENIIIEHCEVLQRKYESDLTDIGGIIFISAYKEK